MVICLERGANDLHIYGPADATATHKNPDWFNLSAAGLPGFSSKRGR